MTTPTIYEALKERLGREPTHAEIKTEVSRILLEGLSERSLLNRKENA